MKKFFVIWSGQVLSLFGSSVVQFALVWYLTRETGSATVLATSTIIALLPALILLPFVGAWVDRWNRKKIMIYADLGIALATLGLAALFLTGVIQIWHIYALIFVRSIGGVFHGPAMMATIPMLVPDKHLVRVNSLNQMLLGGMNIITPPLGALFLEIWPMQAVLAIDVVTAIIAVSCILFVAIPQPARAMKDGKTTVFADMKEGFKFIWSWPGALGLLGAAAIINFFATPLGSLMPIVVRTVFEGGPLELGWMQSAFGIGMIIGGLALSAWGGFKKKIYTSIMGLMIIGVSMGIAGLTPGNLLILFIISVFVFGLAQSFTNSPIFAVLQALVPREMQGRVFALITTVSMIMSPLGLLVAGPIADKYGVQIWYLIAGIVTIGIGLVEMLIPAIRNIESQKQNINEAKTAAPVALTTVSEKLPQTLDE
ncbi:MAG: MFS transporter [Dehalococcoidales bacterium]|nr:MFS transporter [Dehalococcoidales bacterium]